jgi:hypothetical protein
VCRPPAQYEAEKEEESGEEVEANEDDEDIEVILQPGGEAGSDYCLQKVMELQDTLVQRMKYNTIRVFPTLIESDFIPVLTSTI